MMILFKKMFKIYKQYICSIYHESYQTYPITLDHVNIKYKLVRSLHAYMCYQLNVITY